MLILKLPQQNPIRKLNPLHTMIRPPIQDKNQEGIGFKHDDTDSIYSDKINPSINPEIVRQEKIANLRKSAIQMSIRPYAGK